MNIIDIQPYTRTDAEKTAEDLLIGINRELIRRVELHRNSHMDFWRNPKEILTAMGTNAAIFLAAASENIEHISKLALLAGKTLNDFIPESDWKMIVPIKVNKDGTASVESK